MRGWTRIVALAIGAIALAWAHGAAAAIIHFDDFSGTGDLNGVPSDIRPGAETWSSTPGERNADGTPNSVPGFANAFLPFAPMAGAVYMLSFEPDPDIGWLDRVFSPGDI